MDYKTCVIFVLVAMVLALLATRPVASQPTRVVCEQGTFEPVIDAEDPYLRERAVCNVDNSNGRTIDVLVID